MKAIIIYYLHRVFINIWDQHYPELYQIEVHCK